MRRVLLALIVSMAAAWTNACGSSTQTVTAPSTTKCAVNAAANPSSFPASGGSGTLAVSTNRECQWSAAPSGGWIQLGSSTSGQGEGNLSFTVASNADPAVRRGTISVGDQQAGITQEAAPCVFNVSPTSDSAGSGGERKTIRVTASSAQCSWTARSDVDWLGIVEGAQGSGSGQVTYEARATTGPTRTGTLLVAGQVVTITQGQGCSTSIAPTTQNVGASGGSGTISVATAAGCPWAVQSNAAWIAITSGQTGNGPGTVGFSVSPWDGPTRSGTLTIDGHLFTVTQTAGCSYTIDPISQSVGVGVGSGTVNVHTAAGCEWTAASNAPSWLTVSPGAGSGEGRVQFSATANAGPSRTGTVTVAGRTFTVDQASGCSYSLSPDNQMFASGGGAGTINVTAGGGCSWTASTSQPWVHVIAGGTGSGSGTIEFSVDANAGSAREATIAAGGRTFAVHQSAGCSYSLSQTSASFDATGGGDKVSVTTGSNCSWSVSVPPADTWVHITAGASGNGPGDVQVSVDANGGATSRSSTLTIAGVAYTISQAAAAACSYAISPTAQTLDAAGGTGSFTMTAPPSCAWSAAPSDTWLSITAGAAGSGNGTVSFMAAANAGPARTATITAGGQTFTTSQLSGCSIAISPSAQDIGAAGGPGSFNVTTADGCGWTTTSDQSWLTITSGASGSGSGTVAYAVAANTTTASRSGTITVGSQTFTVNQAHDDID